MSDARLTLVKSEKPEHFTISCVEGEKIVAFGLNGSPLCLLVKHEIDVIDGECHTTSYGYRLATGPSKAEWLLRWEYFRQKPKPDLSLSAGPSSCQRQSHVGRSCAAQAAYSHRTRAS